MIKKVVIPAAGLGTRMLPVTKTIPKEMLPIVDKPAIQYNIEEAIASGVEEFIIIVGKNRKFYIDYFSDQPDLNAFIKAKNKPALEDKLFSIPTHIKITYVDQPEPKGLGHAILQAKDYIDDDYFGVILPDDIIDSATPCLKQLCDIQEEYNASVLGTQIVPMEDVSKYGVIDGNQIDEKSYSVTSMVEKPSVDKAPSNLTVVGRYVLSQKIFKHLEETKPGVGNEIQLTDGILAMLAEEKVISHIYDGLRFDVGNPKGLFEATSYYIKDL